MKKRATLIGFSLALAALSAHAYVEPIHQRISRRAYQQALAHKDFLADFGVTSSARRGELEYMFQLGSHDEDAIPRPLNHFFDPAHNIPLTIPFLLSDTPITWTCISAGGVPANEWALHTSGNDRGLQAANEAHYQVWTAGTPADRERALNDLFYTLGHVVHLVQDMAQPEHTRNDQHLSFLGLEFSFGARAASLYERWTGDNLVRYILPNGTLTDGFYSGFDISKGFGSYEPLFKATPGFVQWGLAELTNQNYVTQDTNYTDVGAYDEFGFPRCVQFTKPALPGTFRQQPFVITIRDAQGNPQQITIVEGIYTHVYEHPRGRDTDAFHTIRSALDHETGKYDPQVKVFSLDDNSYRTRAANLLPKAVGYSAALLNRFFRSQDFLRVSWHRNEDGTFRVVVKNYFNEPIRNARIDILARTDQGAVIPVSTQTVAHLPCHGCGPFATDLLFEGIPPQFIYENDAHVVVRGDIGKDPGAVIAYHDKKKTKLEVEFEYVQAGASSSALQVISETYGGGLDQCSGCSVTSRSDGTHVENLLNGIIDKAPFNGDIRAEIGARPGSRYNVFVDVSAADVSKTKQAKVRFRKDNAVVAEYVFNYTDRLRKQFKLDWTGSVTPVP